ncbi:hypothetical protein KDA_65900 [Dictyobacter alpinus]|uniref:Glycosyl transferase n=1 Tax=Dictyobacter alpinus TaxID=2014873 RepID=A0A402BIG3_9CHLR|nr:glycosyltransferase [Dictyobacter alpinus]GCE31106.1 hypothetical protein KDA_65900 [Dictyobacter alpinus]
MKKISSLCEDEAEDNRYIPGSMHVCMHVVRDVQIDIRAQRTAETLARAGCQVTVLDVATLENTIGNTSATGYIVQHINVATDFGATRFTHAAWSKALSIFVRGTLNLLKQPADVYHACELTALPACYLAATLRRKPLIFEAYELPLQDIHYKTISKSHQLWYGFMKIALRYLLAHCTAVIAVSPPIVAELQRRYHISRILLLRNIPYYQHPIKTDMLRQQLRLPASKRIALYQGNLQPDRGLDRLVRAAAYLEPENIIVMLGQNIGTTRAELEQLIMLQKVQAHVKILAPVPYAELATWTASADIGLTIIPLDYTRNMKLCLPNKLFEYIQAGLPVLSSPLEAIRDILVSYNVGKVVRSMNPAEVGMAINSMLKDPDELACMRANALRAAKQDLCWERESLKLIDLYRTI